MALTRGALVCLALPVRLIRGPKCSGSLVALKETLGFSSVTPLYHFDQSRWLRTSMRLMTERRYSDKHEWVSREGDIGTVGISNYAQEALGDVVYVQLPDVDTEVTKGAEVGAVESVKAASEIYTPVTGKVTAINAALEDKPGLVNSSPYEEGWLFRIELSKTEEYDALMDEEQYTEYLKKVKN